MKLLRRWQDWAPLVAGVLLITIPFVFGRATLGSRSLDAWVLGAIVGVVAVVLALLWLGFPVNRVTGGMTVIVGMILLISPWVLGLPWLAIDAWTSCIIGALLVIIAGGLSLENWSRQTWFPTYWARHRGSIGSETQHGYRRVTNPR